MADDESRRMMIREALAQLMEKGGSSFAESSERDRRSRQAEETRGKSLDRFDLDLGAILGGGQARQAGVNEQTVKDMLTQQAQQQTRISRPDADALRFIGLGE